MGISERFKKDIDLLIEPGLKISPTFPEGSALGGVSDPTKSEIYGQLMEDSRKTDVISRGRIEENEIKSRINDVKKTI